MPDVFISYSSTDRSWVSKLANALEKYNLEVWWDPEIKPGQAYREVIQNALDSASCVIVVWSQESIKSIWVQAEATQAIQRNVLIPVSHENARIPMPFNSLQTANLEDWSGSISDKKLLNLISGVALHCKNVLTHEEVKRKEVELLARKQRREQEKKEAELLAKQQKEAKEKKEAELLAKQQKEEREKKEAELLAKQQKEAQEKKEAELLAKQQKEA